MQTATPQTTFWQIDPTGWKVRSKSHPDAAHTVRRAGAGFSCTCPATRRCWHIKTVEATLTTPVLGETRPTPQPTSRPVRDAFDEEDIFAQPIKKTGQDYIREVMAQVKRREYLAI